MHRKGNICFFAVKKSTFVESKKKYSLLLVDDHVMVACGLKQVFGQAVPEITVIDSSTTGNDALSKIQEHPYNIYILDLELPDFSGFDLIDRIREIDPSARIVIHTMHDELWYYKRLAVYHLSGIVYKSSDTTQIIECVRKVLAGEEYLCPKALEFRKKEEKCKSRVGMDLTERELRVLKCIAEGKSTAEIAQSLYISVNTVETHRRHLNEKLDATNVASLLMHAVAKGLLPIH